MKWVEIITLRSPRDINRELVDELLKGVGEYDSPTDTLKHLLEIKTYYHSVVETDLSIHMYWESEAGNQNKSLLGLMIFSALRSMGLLNHSVWIERASREIGYRPGKLSRSGNNFLANRSEHLNTLKKEETLWNRKRSRFKLS